MASTQFRMEHDFLGDREVLDAVMNSRVVGRTVGDLGSHIMCDDACRCRRLELLRRSS